MTVSSDEQDNLERESAESNPSNSNAEDSQTESNQVTSVRSTVSIVIKKSSSQEQRCGMCERFTAGVAG